MNAVERLTNAIKGGSVRDSILKMAGLKPTDMMRYGGRIITPDELSVRVSSDARNSIAVELMHPKYTNPILSVYDNALETRLYERPVKVEKGEASLSLPSVGRVSGWLKPYLGNVSYSYGTYAYRSRNSMTKEHCTNLNMNTDGTCTASPRDFLLSSITLSMMNNWMTRELSTIERATRFKQTVTKILTDLEERDAVSEVVDGEVDNTVVIFFKLVPKTVRRKKK